MRLTDDTLYFSSGYFSTETALPPNLQFQDLEGVSNWLNTEGKITLLCSFGCFNHDYKVFQKFCFLSQPLDRGPQIAAPTAVEDL